MLHLAARIHLDKVQPATLIHQKFDGARIGVPDRRQRLAKNRADLIAQLRSDLRRRRLLEQFLVPALNRAFTLARTDYVAMLVGQYLELNVPGMLHIFLHVEISIPERARGLGLGSLEQRWQLLFIANDSHATAAAT